MTTLIYHRHQWHLNHTDPVEGQTAIAESICAHTDEQIQKLVEVVEVILKVMPQDQFFALCKELGLNVEIKE